MRGLQDPTAISYGQAKLLEIAVGQVREHIDIDAVRGKKLGIPAKTEFLEFRKGGHASAYAPLSTARANHSTPREVFDENVWF